MKKTTLHVESSIIGTLFCWPDYFEKASLHLKPEMFKHYKKAYKWMCKQFDEQRSWDIQIVTGIFGNVSDLIPAPYRRCNIPNKFPNAHIQCVPRNIKRVKNKIAITHAAG